MSVAHTTHMLIRSNHVPLRISRRDFSAGGKRFFDGTTVALPGCIMRPMFLAWLTLALLLLALARLSHAGEQIEVAGFINATDQEADEGYFAVGGDAMFVVKQGSGLQRWLKAHSGQRVRLVLAPEGPTD